MAATHSSAAHREDDHGRQDAQDDNDHEQLDEGEARLVTPP